MTQTTTDYLFQATTAVPDRYYGAAATNSGPGKFDNHLSHASSFADSGSQGSGNRPLRADSPRHDDDNSNWNANSSNSDASSSSASPTSRTDQSDSPDAAGSSERSHSDDRDKSGDSTAAEAAGANQPVNQNTNSADSKNEHDEKAETAEAVKKTAVNKKAVDLNGPNNLDNTAEAEGAAGAPAPDAKHADDAAKLAAKVAAQASKSKENADAATAAENKSKQEKAANNGASKVKAKTGASGSDGDGANKDAAVSASASSETATDAAAKEQAKADAAAAVGDRSAAKRGPDADDTHDGDSKDSRADSQAAARNQAAIAAAKVDAAQLAAGAANAPDASAKASPKGKDGDGPLKPAEAKGEAPAAAFARMSRSNSTGASPSTNGASDGLQVDPSRFIGRVAKAFHTAQDRGGTLQLRLSPPELGALRIELNVKDGVMSASLQTENANARKLLLDHLPALRDRLAEQNIRVDRFEVDVRRDGAGGQADARGWQQQQSQHQPDQSSPRRSVQKQPKAGAVVAPERVASTPTVGDAGLNLIV